MNILCVMKNCVSKAVGWLIFAGKFKVMYFIGPLQYV